MSTERHRAGADRLVDILGRWQVLLGGVIALGLISGALAARRPTTAIFLCLVVAAIAGMALAGDRAFALAVTIVAVAPWYPFIAEKAEQPLVRQKVLCAAVIAAPLVPWLWSLAAGGRRTRSSRGALLMGILFAGLALLIYETLGSFSELIDSKIVGFLALGVAFLCARRFGNNRGWLGAAFLGTVALLVMGADAYLRSSQYRVGYFTGYPITYGALLVGLLPAGVLFAYRRSRLLAGALAAAGATLLIFSESRSSWVAATVIIIVIILLQVRAGNVRGLVAIGGVIGILAILIVGTGSLNHIVEQKLSAKIATTQSVTHREFSYGYAIKKIAGEPFFGAGAPGFSALESAQKTNIGALDNGYLSISVDMGLVGLLAALIPIAVALRVLARCLRFGVIPRYELALALGVLGMALVTIFYDSFYWAQIDLLLGAMGGVLSVRLKTITRPAPAELHARPPHGRRALAIASLS